MKAHSVQFKYLVIVISAILAIAIFAGGFSIYEVDTHRGSAQGEEGLHPFGDPVRLPAGRQKRYIL